MPESLRHVIVHDAGNLYSPFVDGHFSNASDAVFDPETQNVILPTTYPNGSDLGYIFGGGIWVGGIVNGDTLTSCLYDGWSGADEMYPPDPDAGGSIRTGDFANDEFVTSVTDTNSNYNSTPLNIEVTQKSYSWSDTLYDDFVIIDYTMTNIGEEDIADGWIGILLDNDILHQSSDNGHFDDCSGLLDLQADSLYPGSTMIIPYSFDNDGDPDVEVPGWNNLSPRGAISLQFLGASFNPLHVNFNWWVSNGNPALDFGPRRAGTPEDPFRDFSSGALGTPGHDGDRYYLLSHPEVDYDQLYVNVDHSADGWLPPPQPLAIDIVDGYDTRFLLSFGPCDIPAGESITFSVALVAGENLHVNATDFEEYFDPENPDAFYATLDFTDMITHNYRAWEVYESGYTLPNPGPPVGLEITEYGDLFVSLAWDVCDRPDLVGYNIYYRDTDGDNTWYNYTAEPLTDTAWNVLVSDPLHFYEFAVTAVTTGPRESAFSETVGIVPHTPHPIAGVEAEVQYLDIAVQWNESPDTDLDQYYIYRSVWYEEFEKFDSTTQTSYVDATTESGVKYSYYITQINIQGNESEPSETVSGIPMAFDKGILLIDASRVSITSLLYDSTVFENMYTQLAARLPVTRHVIVETFDVNPVTFAELSEYSHIVVFGESRYADLKNPFGDLKLADIGLYLSLGGRGVFTAPAPDFSAMSIYATGEPEPVKIDFSPGDVAYDIFKLDSAVKNIGVVLDGTIPGDLMGCTPLDPEYPTLEADTAQLRTMPLPMSSFIPASGYIYFKAEAEPIYAYNSSSSGSVNDGQVNGIKYLGEDYQFVLFNFSLSLMAENGNYYALLQALNDLGVDIYCGDANDDGLVNLGDAVYLVRYIFMGGPPPAVEYRSDIDCDGDVDIGDAVGIINYVFREHALLRCCP